MVRYNLYCIRLLGVPIYIGVTKRNPDLRFKDHCRPGKPMRRLFQKYGDRIWVETLAVGSRDYIYDLEVKAIKAFDTRYPGGFNLDHGGWGGRNPSPATRRRMSAAHKGRTASPETRAKMSAARQGRGREAWIDPEVNARRRVAQQITRFKPGHRARMSAATTAAMADPARRAAVAAARKADWTNPEYRVKMLKVAATAAKPWSAEHRAKKAVMFADPEYRNKMSAAKKEWYRIHRAEEL